MTSQEKLKKTSNEDLQIIWGALLDFPSDSDIRDGINWKSPGPYDDCETMDDWGQAVYSEMGKRGLKTL